MVTPSNFGQVLASITQKKAVVTLTGPGGSLVEGLSIGEMIRAHGFDTFVVNECSSVCALIWLAGAKHFVDESSVIGFHAAYTKDGTKVRESGSANAVVGAYLTNLGYSYATVAYATSAPPENISWMTAVDTLRLDIDVKFLSKGPGASPAAAPALMAPAPSPEQEAEEAKRIELNVRLDASEAFLRRNVGAETVDALIAWVKSSAATDPSIFQRLYAQPDPYGWAYTQMVELQGVPLKPRGTGSTCSLRTTNAETAAKVEELQRYRSEFFDRLRVALANRPGSRVVGDRFVLQSEVLFPLGSAELTPAGQNSLTELAITIKDIAAEMSPGIQWILRVDGHTDRQPIKGTGWFASNWELSVARAITVVKLLIADGVPPEHLAATGFADYQPLDPADTQQAYVKNRRIELRLTDR